MQLIVDAPTRYARCRAHTGTHLLHAALQGVLPDTRQEGSLVDSDYLRFDFRSEDALTGDQLADIQSQINKCISDALPVSTQEMPLEDARQLGAKMFFEDKYGDEVRVVSIGDKLSVELCGGTHVSRTDSIGSLIITSQEAVSSGVKRITAVTGPRCADAFAKTKQTLTDIQSQIGVAATSQILPKLSKIQSELDDATSTIESLKTKLVGGVLQSLTLVPHQQFDGIIAIEEYPDLAGLQIKTIATQAREIRTNHTILIYDAAGTFALLATGDVSAKSLARELGLRGGGSDELVQGRDSDISIKIS